MVLAVQGEAVDQMPRVPQADQEDQEQYLDKQAQLVAAEMEEQHKMTKAPEVVGVVLV